MERPVIIGITGGSGSGKSTITKAILGKFGVGCIATLEMDSYYRDQSNLSFKDRQKTNYDHPDAFDIDLLIEHIKIFSEGKTVKKPIYDFEIHNRKSEVEIVLPREILIVEGILALEDERIRELLDIKIYVDTDADLRFIRRVVRDINERGRTLESVIEQYVEIVRPMHMEFTETTKKYADIIIPEGGQNKVAIDVITAKIQQILKI